MIIKNSIKAIIIDRTKLLVVVKEKNGQQFYTLPGGGQNPDELMLDALKRELVEETGFSVEPKRLLFIREGFDGEEHRIEFMFICDTIGKPVQPTEYDENQVGTTWISIDNISQEPLYPVEMRSVIKNCFLGKESPIYLGEMQERQS